MIERDGVARTDEWFNLTRFWPRMIWLSGRLPQRALQFAIIYLRLCSNEDIYLFAFRGNAVPDVPAIAWIYALHSAHAHTHTQASISLVTRMRYFHFYLLSFEFRHIFLCAPRTQLSHFLWLPLRPLLIECLILWYEPCWTVECPLCDTMNFECRKLWQFLIYLFRLILNKFLFFCFCLFFASFLRLCKHILPFAERKREKKENWNRSTA